MIQTAGLAVSGLGIVVYLVGVVALRPLARVGRGLLPRAVSLIAAPLVLGGVLAFLLPLAIGLLIR